MGDSHFRRAKFFKRESYPFPDVLACLGNHIGQFNHKHWWHATGKARDMFKLAQKDISGQLQSAFRDTCTSIVHFHLFMIGSCRESAKPVIMFFCQEKKPRKRAQRIINEGGLLNVLPGFRTGHQAQDPTLGHLILPATVGSSTHIQESPILHREVYFDSSSDIWALGMSIFLKNNDGSWRRANAYVVLRGGRYALMSVSHVFFDNATSGGNTTADDDNDFDLGSDSGSEEMSEEQMQMTTAGGLSNPESGFDAILPEPIHETEQSSANYQPHTPELLGRLLEYRIDEDWAVIDITNDFVVSTLTEDLLTNVSIPKHSRIAQISMNANGFVHNVGTAKKAHGMLSEDATYMRLPGSSTFQEVYKITLDTPINLGDCGSVFLDAKTQALYGHVVVSSQHMHVAFITPASHIFGAAGAEWNTISRAPAIEYVFMSPPPRAAAPAGWESVEVEESWRHESLNTALSKPHPTDSISLNIHQNIGSSAKFVFRIDEFTEHPDAPELLDQNGKWIPSALPGYNIRIPGGVSGQWWICNRNNKVQRLPGSNPPVGSSLYKTCSTIYSEGHGFHVLRGDATNPPPEESWQHLWFEWNDTTLSSVLTNAGTRRGLRVQDPNAWWPHMLLPNIYHGPAYTAAGYGGLRGELAIFLALVAFSMKPEMLSTGLPKLTENGGWGTHDYPHGRIDKRGVIVYVYALDNNEEELRALEDGDLGNYYN